MTVYMLIDYDELRETRSTTLFRKKEDAEKEMRSRANGYLASDKGLFEHTTWSDRIILAYKEWDDEISWGKILTIQEKPVH